MKRKLIAGILLCLLVSASLCKAFAHKDNQHYKEIESVLFGTQAATIMGDQASKKLVRHLEYATSIALDQYNGFKDTLLKDLQMYGVPNLPPNVTEIGTENSINFSDSPNKHRGYTHLGWTYTYGKEFADANWPKRKQMMVETTKKVLNSKDEEICDSFAAILYYVHLLGDMQEDSSRTERDQVIPLIEKHGLSDIFIHKPNKDIFIELYHYLSVLFEGRVNKTYLSYYNRMMRKIKDLYSEAKKDMRSNDDEVIKENENNLTSEQLDYYSRELLKALSSNMPILLEHTLFSGVFYH